MRTTVPDDDRTCHHNVDCSCATIFSQLCGLMSEPMLVDSQDTGDAFQAGEDDKTQPADEILNALRQLNPNTFSHTQNGSQSVHSPIKQDPTPPPLSEWEQLREQLRTKPYDADGWLKLVDLAEDSGDIERVKQTYEGLLEAYPNTVRIHFVYLATSQLTFIVVFCPDCLLEPLHRQT